MAETSDRAPGARQGQPLVRRIAVQTLGPGERLEAIETSAAERAAIAALLGLAALESLSAELRLRRWHGQGVVLQGMLRAHVVQSCVVTLEPVPADIVAEFERRYLPADMLGAEDEMPGEEVFVNPDDAEPPEPFADNAVDAGPAIVEELALALDPYPRAPGVVFVAAEPAEEADAHPFAALARLRRRE